MKRSLIAAVAVLLFACTAACTKSSSTQTSSTAQSGVAGSTSAPAAAEPLGDAVRGKDVFVQNCAQCHGPDGTQGGIGPSLKNEKSRKDEAATIVWIKDPKPPMPKLFPQPLTEKDVEDAAAYVQSL